MSDDADLTSGLLKGATDVAKVFVEKVSEGIGGLYKPHQIVRIAKAEAKAQIIAANARVEIGEIEQRAAQRWIAEETKKQENIESITRQAIPLLDETAKPESMEGDWIANFFEKSRLTSDEQIQTLWSKVLAGEANNPGKFSRRTVNLLADLDKQDALLFSQLCNFMWSVGQPLVFDTSADIYTKNGLNFGLLSHLDSLGLIKFENISDFTYQRVPKPIAIGYQGRFLRIAKRSSSEEHQDIPIGKVMFTGAGTQLSTIVHITPIAGFFEYVKDVLSQRGYEVIGM
jgi:hypothetical protein